MNSLRGISGRNYSFDAEDHLLTAGSVSYQFDADGFLVSKTDGTETTSYDYSSRGELLSVTLPDGTVISYEHDPLGRRIAKKVNGAVVEKYLWRGLTTLLAVYDGSDNLLMRFEYADDRMPVAVMIGGATYYLSYDQIGTLKAVTDASGSVVKQIDYDSFGNIISDTNPSLAIPFGFAGGLHDRDTGTGLVRFGYRDYAPEIGRWTGKDPIFFDGGDTNLFGYVKCDPVNGVDILGLTFQDPSCINKCAVECGGSAVTCAWSALYFPVCEAVCLLVIRDPFLCTVVCTAHTVYEVNQCLNEQEKCLKNCMNKCPIIDECL